MNRKALLARLSLIQNEYFKWYKEEPDAYMLESLMKVSILKCLLELGCEHLPISDDREFIDEYNNIITEDVALVLTGFDFQKHIDSVIKTSLCLSEAEARLKKVLTVQEFKYFKKNLNFSYPLTINCLVRMLGEVYLKIELEMPSDGPVIGSNNNSIRDRQIIKFFDGKPKLLAKVIKLHKMMLFAVEWGPMAIVTPILAIYLYT